MTPAECRRWLLAYDAVLSRPEDPHYGPILEHVRELRAVVQAQLDEHEMAKKQKQKASLCD